jgi:hypothetical protein
VDRYAVDMQKVKDLYLCGRRMQVGDGKLTSFWCDAWCGLNLLKETFPDIFDICNEQDITVVGAATLGWNFSSRRSDCSSAWPAGYSETNCAISGKG